MAWASTVAVVVPSPATSEVFDATSFTICAPRFASLSSSSISLATVTPSLVIVGAPHDRSMSTLRPRGPSVTLTVLARVLSPVAMLWRAFRANTMFLADMMGLYRSPDQSTMRNFDSLATEKPLICAAVS